MMYKPNSTSNPNIEQSYACAYRLPCGYCMLLGSMCPNFFYNTIITCQADATNKVELNNTTTTTNMSEITNK